MNDLESIISKLEQQREGIERALAALREIGGSEAAARVRRPGRPAGSENGGGKRQFSAAVRKRMAESQRRRRLVEQGSGKIAEEKTTPARKKRRLSAAGRKRLSDAMKARWASGNPPRAAGRKRAGKTVRQAK